MNTSNQTSNQPTTKATENTFLQSLPVPLTEEEKMEFGKLLAHEHSEQEKTEDELASVKLTFKSRAAAHEKRISHLAECLNTGREYRNVECERRYELRTREVAIIRLDTYEEVERRPMTATERQTQMEL